MAITPQTLFDEAKCFLCFEISEDEALELALLARILAAGFGPGAPSNLLIRLTTTNGNIIIDWTASAGTAPTTYEIWRSVNGGAFAQVGTVAGGVTTFTHLAVMPANDQWYYEVRACTGAQCSAFTDPAGIFNTFSKLVNNGTVVYSFPFLQFCFGDFAIFNQLALTTISTPRLRKCTGQYIFINNDVMTNFDATSLITAVGVGVADMAILTTASYPALTSTTDYFTIRTNAALISVSAPLLATIATSLQFSNTVSSFALSLPALTSIGTDIDGSGSAITSLSLPALTTVGNGILCGVNAALASVNLNSLVSVGVNIDFNNNTSLTSLSFPALTTINGSFDCDNCTALTTLSIPNLVFPDAGLLIDASGCVLLAASVNQVLARGVASATTTNDYELNNPGNAAPTGQGLLDKATLIGLGNTVNTN